MRGTRRVARRTPTESAWRAAVEIGAVLVVAAGVLASPFVYIAVRISEQPSHPSLQAIPINSRACSEIHAIRSAGSSFEDAWYAAFVSKAPWTVSRSKMERILDALDRSLGLGIPVVPTPVRSRLTAVLTDVRRGKVIVKNSTSFGDVLHNGYRELNAAFSSFGDAATLVGDACGSLDVYTGPRASSPNELASLFAGAAAWACGAQPAQCPATTTTVP